jgi:hypothetical protein
LTGIPVVVGVPMVVIIPLVAVVVINVVPTWSKHLANIPFIVKGIILLLTRAVVIS